MGILKDSEYALKKALLRLHWDRPLPSARDLDHTALLITDPQSIYMSDPDQKKVLASKLMRLQGIFERAPRPVFVAYNIDENGDDPSFINGFTPGPSAILVPKTGDSAIYRCCKDTNDPLASRFHQSRLHHILVCGANFSGCVYATVLDLAGYGFATYILQDACVDGDWREEIPKDEQQRIIDRATIDVRWAGARITTAADICSSLCLPGMGGP